MAQKKDLGAVSQTDLLELSVVCGAVFHHSCQYVLNTDENLLVEMTSELLKNESFSRRSLPQVSNSNLHSCVPKEQRILGFNFSVFGHVEKSLNG